MYFVEKEGGYNAQQRLWEMIERGILAVHPGSEPELERMNSLMAKYQDTPMDFADASLVVAAEVLNVTRIFTLDTDFYVYRINNKTPFEILS